MTVTAQAYFLEAAKAPLVRKPLEIPDPGPTEAIVEVIACGLCLPVTAKEQISSSLAVRMR